MSTVWYAFKCRACGSEIETVCCQEEGHPTGVSWTILGFCRACFDGLDPRINRLFTEHEEADVRQLLNDLVPAVMERIEAEGGEDWKESLSRLVGEGDLNEAVRAVGEYRVCRTAMTAAQLRRKQEAIAEAQEKLLEARKRLTEFLVKSQVTCLPLVVLAKRYERSGLRWFEEVDLTVLKAQAETHWYNPHGYADLPDSYARTDEDEEKYTEAVQAIRSARDSGDRKGLFYRRVQPVGGYLEEDTVSGPIML